ncbi:MAG: LPS export ABC transporter permease LptF [Syntrophales bacterium]|nr:LPS export ABC transporter permease LptF [Syntrophales bacterium]
MPKIINRYILREISLPFFMILFVLTFVLLMGKILQLMDLMVNKGVSLLDIAKIIFFLMPSFLIFAIPISLLISILIALGRLSGDNEITSMKASGISLYQLLYPIALASLIAFLMTAVTSLFLVPHTNYATKDLLFNIARQKVSVGIKEKIFHDDFKGLLIYVDKMPARGNLMEGVMISDNRISREPATIIARRAYLISDPKSLTVTLRLEDGSTHMVDKNMKNYQKMDFSFYELNLDMESSISGVKSAKTKDIVDMTFGEMVEQMKSPSLEEKIFRELAIELNKKFSIPVSCIVFGILGIPLGIRAHRSVRSRGFSLGLLVVLLYYLLQLGGDALVETGRLSPLVGTWAPNVVFGTVGIYLLIMTAKEKPVGFRPRLETLRRLINSAKG